MRRWIVLLLVFALVGSTARASLAQIADADKAARGKDWTSALAAYEAANMAAPSADALEGAANARYQLKQDGDAYAAYAEWLEKYGAKAPAQKRATAQARLKELEARTGTVAIDVNEAGAQIIVDDKLKGFSPLRAPLRLAAGPHRVRVTKDGFAPFEGTPNVVAGAPTITLAVKLEAASSKGRLSVREKTGKPIRVIVDGVDMGDAPWSGELDAGSHEISGRSPSMAAAPEKVTIERGKETVVELEASAAIAPLKISTSDGKGLIYLDDKLVGEGSFAADVPAGPHQIRVTREGYDTFEERIVVKDKEPLARSITLRLGSTIETGPVQVAERPLEGVYGGFQLMGALGLGGMDSSPEKLCKAGDRPPEVASCDSGSVVGGGVGGFLGYHWDPVGVELFMLAQYDQQSPSFVWNASSVDPGIGPDPARTEDFRLRRVGGLAAARVRLTLQGEKVRFSTAGGLGLSTRSLFLTRDTRSSADPRLADKLVSDGQGYLSLALSLEPSIQYRLGESTAVMAGVSIVVDNPTSLDEVPRTAPEGNHRLGPNGLTTPSYDLTSGTQVWTGLFVGMMFGP
jgi:hypothetical protein